jgi:glycosyltransferase involved in cell wall biosynthesis
MYRILNNRWYFSAATHLKIFLTLGKTPEPVYGGMMEQIGVGGVETAFIELAKYLAQLGHTVYLFSDCEKEHIYDSVYYIPYNSFKDYIKLKPDILVTSRWFDSLYDVSCKKIVWLQDAYFSNPSKPDAFKIADKIVCSSLWHRYYIAERFTCTIDSKKISIIPLSVDRTLFNSGLVKDKLQAVYCSNPDRGLYELFDMWKEITEKVPGIYLSVCYGWEGLNTWCDTTEWKNSILEQKQKAEKFAETAGNIRFLGRLKKSGLYSVIKSSYACLYPNNFFETFCLTGIECQLAGTPMITSDIGALSTTMNREGNYLIHGNPKGKKYQKDFIDSTVQLFTDSSVWETKSNTCRIHANLNTPSWKDVSLQWQDLFWEII